MRFARVLRGRGMRFARGKLPGITGTCGKNPQDAHPGVAFSGLSTPHRGHPQLARPSGGEPCAGNRETSSLADRD